MQYVQGKEFTEFMDNHGYKDGDLVIKGDKYLMIGKAIHKPYDVVILEQKLKKKNEILKKARIKRKNQREELHKLNLKLQKCISLEQHNKIVDELKKDINFRNETIKNTLQIGKDRLKEIEQLKAEIEFKNEIIKELEDLNRILKQDGAIKDLSISRVEEQNKEIEKLKAVIEYLESKAKMKYNTEYERNEKKVRLFMYIKNKPFRDFSIAVDNLSKAIVKCIPNKISK